MDQQELKATIGSITNGIEQAIKVDAKSPANVIIGALMLSGISVLGELFLDVKRIADAAEETVAEAWSAPVGAGQRVSRVLAAKEALRKLGGPQVTDGPEESADNKSARQAWVNENWPAFQSEAAELLAAMRSDGALSRDVPGTKRDN